MRYELQALVADPAVLEPLAELYPAVRVVPLTADLALLPVTEQVSATVGAATRVSCETGFWKLTDGVADGLLAAGSRRGPIAYIEADYLGRDGRQTAAVWQWGAIVYGPEILGRQEPFPAHGGGPIGAVLRLLGVQAAGRDDEFVVLGLGRFRLTEQWLADG